MYTPEQLRQLENLHVAYDTWLDNARRGRACGARLVWKTVKGSDYLYEITSRTNNGRSMGVRSTENERLYRERQDCRSDCDRRKKTIEERLSELAAIHTALRLPKIDSRFATILREFDISQLLGTALLVVGTNAMTAYELEAQVRFADGIDSTLDADFTWSAAAHNTALLLRDSETPPVLSALKRIDDTYTINSEKTFQARDASGYEVEVLLAPSQAANYPPKEKLRPFALPEQEWLLMGRQIEHVTFDARRRPARLVVPDPRWMALHKAWLAEKPGRNPLKVRKDAAQAKALATAVMRHMPHMPVDQRFQKEVPPELRSHFNILFSG